MVSKLKPWYERLPDRWNREQVNASRFLTDVTAGISETGRAFVEGTYSLRLNCGHELGQYRIRIEYPKTFPHRRCHPAVFLLSHHEDWQWGYDSHIEGDWKLCLFVPLESGLDFERKDELIELFPHIHTFLFRERIYQADLRKQFEGGAHAVWPGPDRAHGIQGLLEAIAAEGGRIGRNEPCVCGSGQKYKRCCYRKLWGKMLTPKRAWRRRTR